MLRLPPMDDLHLCEIQSLTERARAKLHPDEFRAVVTLARLQIQERLDDSQKKWHLFLSKTLKWLLPVTPAKFWGAVYALDLPYLHDELNPAEKARAIGCTRAAISFQMQDFAKFLKMEPSRWMRDDEAVKNSREARMEDDL
jgi:hypothetical protein